MANAHSLNWENGLLTIRGVARVTEISERQAVLRLEGKVLTVRGSGLNVAKLDKEQGVVVMEAASVASIAYHQAGMSIKGLFK